MANRILLTLACIAGLIGTVQAQSPICSSLALVNAFPDSINPSTYQFSIQFNAPPSAYIGYPYIPQVNDCNGSTVATGNLFYFGQLGQSTLDFPVTLTGAGSITCYPLSLVFAFIDSSGLNDSCLFTYGASGIVSQPNKWNEISLYPNPSPAEITVQRLAGSPMADYSIRNTLGQPVLFGQLNADLTRIQLGELPDGLYLFNTADIPNRTLRIVKHGVQH
jgi:hypothetical protein